MTRTVFDNAMTAHVWAAQNQPRGQSHNGNLWFEGRSIYSYGTHFCAGYAAPGGLWLTNADDSSMTTKGKHMPAVRAALDYGRGAFENCHSVPGLTETAREFDRFSRGKWTAAERVKSMAKHLESCAGGYWPGPEAGAAILVSCGASPAEAARRAHAIDSRLARKAAQRKARKEARELDQNARLARVLAANDPRGTAEEVREKLTEAATAARYTEARLLEEARELGREAFRAAKAARAKGWTRIAAGASAHHRAARAELARYERMQSRYTLHAATRDRIKLARTLADQIRQFWKLNPFCHPGPVAPQDLGSAVSQCERGHKAFKDARKALADLASGPWVSLALCGKLNRWASELGRVADQLQTRASALRSELQREARGLWYESGATDYRVGQLCDPEGGALLRAKDVTRDDSGQITGGTLQTSWGATVPLPHAIRAFRFLKLCRERGETDPSFDGWEANGKTIRVGHFRIDRVDSRGNFRAGCHRINWAECSRLAGYLGLSDLAPDLGALEDSRGAA